MRFIDKIVVHSSDTPDGVWFDVDDIRKWHVEERGWSDVGYHYVVLLDGLIQKGREDKVIGAHVRGHNASSIGICYIGGGEGKDTRNVKQKATLVHLISTLRRLYPDALILGHRDFHGVTKQCPGFDAEDEYGLL